MANTAKHSYRSRLAQNNSLRGGPRGFPLNPGDFSTIARPVRHSSRSEYLKAKWDFLPASAVAFANRLSSPLAAAPAQSEFIFEG